MTRKTRKIETNFRGLYSPLLFLKGEKMRILIGIILLLFGLFISVMSIIGILVTVDYFTDKILKGGEKDVR